MAENTQQASGGGVKTGQQAAETEIEIIEEGAGTTTDQHQRGEGDAERAGQYQYDSEGGEEEEGDARTGHAQQGGTVQADQQGGTQQDQTARQRRRQREKIARDRERSELVRLRQENAALHANQRQLDSRISNVEVNGIDGQIASLESEIQRANSVMRRAMESQNGEDFVRAQEIRDVLRDRLTGLKGQKTTATTQRGEAQGGRQQVPPGQQLLPNGLHPQQVQFAQIFKTRHPWYDTAQGTRDQDSLSIQQLDNEMMNEGFNPTLPEYWVELERRVQEDLPHRFQQNAGNAGGNQGGGGGPNAMNNGNGQKGNGGRPAGGPRLPGNSSNGGGNGGQPLKFHLSAARKQALIDLGVYGDPAAMKKHIQSFMAWDKDHPTKQ